jgi:hypothetical protein
MVPTSDKCSLSKSYQNLLYLTISIGRETLSETFLETLPKPLKNFDIPLKPVLPIIVRSTLDLVTITSLNEKFASIYNCLLHL